MDRSILWQHVPEAVCVNKRPHDIGFADEVITCVASHPQSDILLLGTATGKIVAWDPEQGERIHAFQAHGKDITRIVFTGNGRRFLTTSVDGFVHWWDHQFNRLQGYSTGSPLYCAAISPRGRELATGGQDSKLRVWDVENGNLLHTLEGHQDAVSACTWTSDGILVSGSSDGMMRAWQVDVRRCYKQFRAHMEHVSQLERSKIGNWYLSASWDHTIKVWNFQHREKFAFPAGSNSITALSLTADETLLAAAYWDGTIRIWNMESGKLHDEFAAHDECLVGCAFIPGTQALVTVDQQGHLRSWSLDELGVTHYLNRHGGEVYAVRYTPDNVHLVSVGHDSKLKVWDRNSCAEISSTETHLGPVTACAIAPDNRHWALGTSAGTVKFWDVKEDRVEATMTVHREAVTSVHFLPAGDRLMTGSWDMKVKVWLLETQTVDCVGDGHNAEISSCDVSPDGRTLISASWDGTARLWDIQKRARRDLATELRILEGHDGRILCCAFSPDGMRAVTGSADQTLRIWTVEQREEPRILLGHPDAVTACRFTPDGRLLLSADRAGHVMLWDAEHGRPLGSAVHDHPILSLAVAPDGLQAAIGDEVGNVRFLEIQSERGPNWIVAAAQLRPPPLWKRGAPMIEHIEATCIYCGNTEAIKQKQLGELWHCGKCAADMMICPKPLPPTEK